MPASKPLKILIFFLFFLGSSYAQDKPIVLSSIHAYRFLIEAIAGDTVQVDVLVPDNNKCHHDFEPTPSQIFNALEAKIWFQVGDSYEIHMQKLLDSKDIMCVDLRKNVELLKHCHKKCQHEAADPHVWLSPKRLITQANTIKEALITAFPEKQKHFRVAYEKIATDLENLDRELQELVKNCPKRSMAVSHAAFGYFCSDYNIEQIAVEEDENESGTFSKLQTIEKLKSSSVKTIFLQNLHNNKAALRIAQDLKLNTLTIDPQAEDYFSNLRQIAKLFVEEG